jgi:DNA-directed RNA polymerase subunit RPC12/RpoP
MTKQRFGNDPFHNNSTYICGICGKRTRDTGYGESGNDSCKKCYVEGGLENHHNDEGHETIQYEDGIKCPDCPEEIKGPVLLSKMLKF